MAVFNIGDKVEAIDDVIRGVVSNVNGNAITVQTEDDFPLVFEAKELVIITGNIPVSNYEIAKIKREKELPKKRRPTIVKSKERNLPKMEVDLHINHLVKNPKGMGNHEMLNLQIDSLSAISFCIYIIMFIIIKGEKFYRPGVSEDMKEKIKFIREEFNKIKF